MDKLNKIGLNIGSVKNDLLKHSSKREEEKDTQVSEKPSVAYNHLDPNSILDAMKKHGLHNLNNVVASGNMASKSISESMDLFSSVITPEIHGDITEKVQNVCTKEFPSVKVHPDVIAEVVDDIIFDALTA